MLEEIGENSLARNFFYVGAYQIYREIIAFKETFEEFKLIMDILKIRANVEGTVN